MLESDDDIIIDETINRTLSIIKEIDLLLEREGDSERIHDMLLLREELVQSIEKITRSYLHIED